MGIRTGHDADAREELGLHLQSRFLGFLRAQLLPQDFVLLVFQGALGPQLGEFPFALPAQNRARPDQRQQGAGHDDDRDQPDDRLALRLLALAAVEGVQMVAAGERRPAGHRFIGEVAQRLLLNLRMLAQRRPDDGRHARIGRERDLDQVDFGIERQEVRIGLDRLGQRPQLGADFRLLGLAGHQAVVFRIVELVEVFPQEFRQRLAEGPGLVQPLAQAGFVVLPGDLAAAVEEERQPADQDHPGQQHGEVGEEQFPGNDPEQISETASGQSRHFFEPLG